MKRKIAVVGLGYVGLPLAVAFGKQRPIIGYDLKQSRIEELAKGHDRTGEISAKDIRAANIDFTTDPSRLSEAEFIIVAVPTPIDSARRPDLEPLKAASEIVGRYMAKGSIIVYESTVYPGVTEDVCGPILERESGMKCGEDFFLGYSPERINPGDKVHTLENIIKVVSAQTPEVLDVVAGIYGVIVNAGVFRASSIKTAEAAKVIENTQRDLNIALVNELAVIFQRLGIDTQEVLEAAGTKWNFLPFRPGLVGGHCIGVDPFYLTHKAEELGYHAQVILAGRRINDSMGPYVAQQAIKEIARSGGCLKGARVGILGLTFKEDVADLRNSKVFDIINELEDYGIKALVFDPVADPQEIHEKSNGFQMVGLHEMTDLDAVMVAVAHKEFVALGAEQIGTMIRPQGVVLDIKGIFKAADFAGKNYWRL